MFRSRKLTFKDVFIRSGVNIEAEPAQLALAKLNEFHSGREANATIFFTHYSGGSETLHIYVDGEFMGQLWLKDSRIGMGKLFLWQVDIDKGKGNWFAKDVCSAYPTLKAKGSKSV